MLKTQKGWKIGVRKYCKEENVDQTEELMIVYDVETAKYMLCKISELAESSSKYGDIDTFNWTRRSHRADDQMSIQYTFEGKGIKWVMIFADAVEFITVEAG